MPKHAPITDRDVVDAYLYLLGRVLVLRQQRRELDGGLCWNRLMCREPGAVARGNPNLDLVSADAWVAVDEHTCVLLEIPPVDAGRYYTWHMLNGWGATILNINERTRPDRPCGRFALCLAGSRPAIPDDAVRVDLPSRTSRAVARVAVGSDPREAQRLLHRFTLESGNPIVTPPVVALLDMSDTILPGAGIFDRATEIADSEPDGDQGMDNVRVTLPFVSALAKSGPDGRGRVDGAIRRAWSALAKLCAAPGPRNGWIARPAPHHAAADFRTRTLLNLVAIWANHKSEVADFDHAGLEGSRTYLQTFPSDALPADHARFLWSVTAVDAGEHRLMTNALERVLLNAQSPLAYNGNGSLTLVYSPDPPVDVPPSNWLPTPPDAWYNLTFRFYGPSREVAEDRYVPPPLIPRR